MEPTPREQADRILDRILKALRGAMADRGVKFYAQEIGVSHASLLHKIEPENTGDALTLRQFALLLVLLPAGEVMRPLAAELGGMWFSLPPASQVGADLHRLMTEAAAEFGDVSRSLLDGTDPNGPGGVAWTDGEIDRLERETDEAVAKFKQIIEAARRNRAAPHLRAVGP
jgi:hypothetical protein